MNSICAGIISYNPDLDVFKDVILSIIYQVEHLYIYDNNSKNISEIKSLCESFDSIEIIASNNNDGISKAYNILCDLALKQGYDWILTLDHDSIVCENLISSYCELYNEPNIGIICPRINYIGCDIPEKGEVETRYTKVTACMTSGSFMSLKAWKEVGGFDEWMFIDWVDNDICMKFYLGGYQIIRDNNVCIDHHLGNPINKKIWGINIIDFQYSHFRVYHIIRNQIYFFRKYYKYKKENSNIKYFAIICKTIMEFLLISKTDKELKTIIRSAIKDGKKIRL